MTEEITEIDVCEEILDAETEEKCDGEEEKSVNKMKEISKKASDFLEIVATVMLILFAFLPAFSFREPKNHGRYFWLIGTAEILAIISALVVYLVYFARKCKAFTFKKAFIDTKNAFWGYVKRNKHILIFMLMGIFVLISFILTKGKVTKTYIGTEHKPEGLFMYGVFFSLFLFASFVKKSPLKTLIVAFYIAIFTFVALIAIQQYYGVLGTKNQSYCPKFLKPLYDFYGSKKIRAGHFYLGETGTFYNLNHMGYFIAIGSMLISGMFIKAKSKTMTVITGLLLVISFWALVVNNTFGAFLAVIATLIFFTAILCFKKPKKKVKIFAPIAIFIAVCIGVSLIPYQNSDKIIIGNFTTLTDDTKTIISDDEGSEDAGSGRWELWTITFDLIGDKPFFGHGINNVNKLYNDRGVSITRAHCEPMEIAVSAGIPAALCYVLAISYLILRGVRKDNLSSDKSSLLAPLMAATAYFLSGLVGVFLFYTASHFFVMLGLLTDEEEAESFLTMK